jgi:hypothetical protein
MTETQSLKLGERMERLEQRVDSIAGDVTAIRNAIMGDISTPGGIVQRVRDNEQRLASAEREVVRGETAMRSEIARLEVYMKTELAIIAARREELVAEYDRRVHALEEWRLALHNRSVGLIIGLSLGSAGVGASVGAAVSHFLGG